MAGIQGYQPRLAEFGRGGDHGVRQADLRRRKLPDLPQGRLNIF